MELKPYQQQVIDDLTQYLDLLEGTPHLGEAFRAFWSQKGVVRMEPYKNNLPGVPHLCAKVPTAGGKTYLAVNAIKPILDSFAVHNPGRPQLVVWLVPSLTILDQTIKNLSDPEHPYNKRLNNLFRNRVVVYEKRDMLMGAGFSADSVREQLSIVVMSFDSFRSRKKEDRKIYQDNGYLASFLTDREDEPGSLLPNYDPSSLINVLRSLKPLVIVDESHNAETDLSVEMLVNLNPHFVLDLTATPRRNSNIISYVDAMALKRHNMVKLPVIVANRQSRGEVIESALILRRQLEEIAVAEEQRGGKYIRPIVLFQAQPKIGDDSTTYEKVRERLVELQIPASQIKIKTADLNELKGVDLMSRDCPVRYIITVNALKEGWDCPNAYILASLADKSSPVDVEQILGRVLRMPHVQQHSADLLNMSYVFTASNRFMDTLQSVVRALNKAGFSDKDYRTVEPTEIDNGSNSEQTSLPFFTPSDVKPVVEDTDDVNDADTGVTPTDADEIDTSDVSKDWAKVALDPAQASASTAETVAFVEAVKAKAATENKQFNEKANTALEGNESVEMEEKMNKHRLKELFRAEALSIRLPQFFMKVATGGWFDNDDFAQVLEPDELLKEFKLAQADANISFADVDGELYRIDLEKVGDGDYSPKPFKIDVAGRQKFNSIILAGARESQVRNVTARIAQLIGNMYPMTDPEVFAYVERIVQNLTDEQIRDCLERDVAYVRKIKQKIKSLASIHAYKAFNDLLDVEKIVVQPAFSLPETIAPAANAPALPKSLYSTESAMGPFETRMINEIVNLESVKWWHRNQSRGRGFRINGFINHYPDFILLTGSGKIVVVETKGDDRDNTDSEMKLKLGKLWAAKAGSNFRYIMVFEHNPIDGAETLSDALRKISQF